MSELLEQIHQAKRDNKPFYYIYDLFIHYCYEKNIGIYSKNAFEDIVKLFPKDENTKLYEYCVWMYKNQIDF